MNPDLLQLQSILRTLGYLLVQPIAGELDDPTRTALRAFQRTHRLQVTPEGTPKPQSPYSLKAKMEAWLRLFGIDEAWLDEQMRRQNEEFEKSGSGARLVRSPKH